MAFDPKWWAGYLQTEFGGMDYWQLRPEAKRRRRLRVAEAIVEAAQYSAAQADRLARLEAENRALREALAHTVAELEEVRDWACTEQAPLRSQELASIVKVIASVAAVLEKGDE